MNDIAMVFRDYMWIFVFIMVYCSYMAYLKRKTTDEKNPLSIRLKRHVLVEKEMEEEKVSKPTLKNKIEARLMRTGSHATFKDIMVLMFSSILVLFLTTYTMLGSLPVAVFAACFGFFTPSYYITFLETKRRTMFLMQLDNAISQMVSVIRTGQTITQAIDSVTTFDDPLGEEFRMVKRDLEMNAGVEEALRNLLRRVNTQDVVLLVTGLVIARDVGSQVAVTVLENIGTTMQKREMAKRAVLSLTAMGRHTATLVGLLPLSIFFLMWALNPSYLDPFLNTGIGQILIALAAVLNVLGYIVARRITSGNKLVDF